MLYCCKLQNWNGLFKKTKYDLVLSVTPFKCLGLARAV